MDSSENPGPWESVGEDQITHLDISDNGSKRGCLDNRLQKLLSLQNLRARRSNISSISWHSMYNFNELVVLDLSCNELEAAMLEYLPVTMRDVDLSKNKLVSLIDPASNEDPVIVLPNLTRLDVSNNKLTKLPRLMEVPSLQILCFGCNQIADISTLATDLIKQCSKYLTNLEGPNNQLHAIPNLSQCAKLATIDFGDNRLYEVPTIGNSVVRMDLSNNSIPSIRDLLGGKQLNSNTYRSSLVGLRMRCNKLTELDEDVVRCLINVTVIDVGQNDLQNVPNALGYLPHLRSFQLDGNPIRVLRKPLLSKAF